MSSYENQIKKFNSLADTWDLIREPEEKVERVVCLSEIGKGMKVLDVGCGTGIMDNALIKSVGEVGFVKAIDISDGMLSVAKRKYNFDNLVFEEGNIETFDEESESYDAVICNNVFPHFVNVDRVLRNVNRLLKVGGVFTVSHLSGRAAVNKIHSDTECFKEDKVPEPKKWIEMFKPFGFENVMSMDEKDFYIIVMRKA
ncbi:MAG: class I SAM-dependent methyltransferase [Abditibacteriota bacterium]|nr:class I SAM-dependent methyltransferase [Abditibacteriota bacterium]